MTYQQWCQEHGCDHAHCPYNCEHPQPLVITGNVLVCGRCYILDSLLTEMVACNPKACHEAQND